MKRLFTLLIVVSVALMVILSGCPSGDSNTSTNTDQDQPISPTASFSLSNLSIQPLSAKPGATVAVDVRISNIGGSSGRHDVAFTVDGQTEDTKEVNLAAGASTNLTFSTSRMAAGTYNVGINSASGTFTVVPATIPQEVMELANYTQQMMDTLKYESTMGMMITGAFDLYMASSLQGIINLNEKQMFAAGNIFMSSSQISETLDAYIEMYMIEDWMYMYAGGMPDTPDQWLKAQIPASEVEDVWRQQDITINQFELIQEFVEVQAIGEETIRGVDCYKYLIIPDMERLWQWVQGQNTGNLDLDGQAPLDIFDEFEVIVWVSKDTYLLMKETMDVTFSMGDGTDQVVANMTASFIYYDINVPVELTLPDEAIAAEDVS